jgi:hypothetical protein
VLVAASLLLAEVSPSDVDPDALHAMSTSSPMPEKDMGIDHTLK